ncbi:MAG: OsmC family protein [Winogradskyella sp.]|nr:OsmC family protein [Winogradskyella sp.]MBT8376982.1 OsmC family protein [Bacteroidia bacterium]NNC44767.1 OsmC family protein [Winogradskyella sp.]NNF86775.1 OsmC family protein [Winogradskyella sp.]NNK40543.1 OsmC family protein [Winogradskyella sp.]
MINRVSTQWKGGLTFESDNPSGKTVVMDTEVEGSTQRFGLSPKAMMLSALAGCSALDVISILEKMKIELKDFRIDVEGELTEEHPKYYHAVVVNYHFYGADNQNEKCERAVKLSVEKYCGVMEMFRQFAKISVNTFYH